MASLIGATGVVTAAAVVVSVVRDALTVAVTTIVRGAVAVVIQTVVADFFIAERHARTHQEGLRRSGRAAPVVAARAAAVLGAGLTADAALLVYAHAQRGRAIFGLLAALAQVLADAAR